MNFWFLERDFVLRNLHSRLRFWPLPEARSCAYVALQQRAIVIPARHFEKGSQMTSIKSITEKLSAWRRYREAVRELSQLTDRELEDIGVRRGDIPFIAAGAARRAA